MAVVTIDAAAIAAANTGATAWLASSTFKFNKTLAVSTLTGIFSNLGDVTARTKVAQGFQIASSDSVKVVRLGMRKQGSPTDNLTVSIYSDSSGSPGTLLGTSEALLGSKLNASTWYYRAFEFATPVALSASTQYHLVIERSGAVSATNYYQFASNQGNNPYANGQQKNFDGSVWTAPNSGNDELSFRVQSADVDWYQVTQDTKLHVWKSTNNGGSWTELDAGNGPTVFSSTNPFSAAFDPHPGDNENTSRIDCVYFTAANTLRVRRFNIPAGTWESADLQAADATVGAINTRRVASISRQNENVIFFTSSADDADLGYSRRTTAAWTASVTGIAALTSASASSLIDVITTPYETFSLALYYDIANFDASFKTLTSTTAGTEVDLNASAADTTAEQAPANIDVYYESGAYKATIPFILAAGTLVEREITNLGVTSASLTQGTQNTVSAATTYAGNQLASTKQGSDRYIFASKGTGIDFFKDTGSTGTWGSVVNWKTGLTSARLVSAIGCATGILVVYTENGDTKSDFYVPPTTSTRIVPQSAHIQTTLTRSVPQTGHISVSNLTRTVPQTAHVRTTLTRTIPQSAAILTTLARTVPQSAHIKATNTRTVPQDAAILTALTRTVPQTAVISTALLNVTRTVPQTAAIRTTLTRTVPQTASVSTGAKVSGDAFLSQTGRIWEYNGKLYLAESDWAGTLIQMLGSSDWGRTWSKLDSVNSPSNDNIVTNVNSWLDAAGGIIYVTKRNTAGAISVQRFDVVNDIWLTPITGNATTSGGSTINIRVIARSANDVWVFYRPTTPVLEAVKWNGTSWGSPVTITTDASGNAFSVGGVVDSAGYITFFFDDPTLSGDGGLNYVTISPAGTVSAEQQVYLSHGVGANPTQHLYLGNDGSDYAIFVVFNNDTVSMEGWRIELGGAAPRTITKLGASFGSDIINPITTFTRGGVYYILGEDVASADIKQATWNGSSWSYTTVYPWTSADPPPSNGVFSLLGGIGFLSSELYASWFEWLVPPLVTSTRIIPQSASIKTTLTRSVPQTASISTPSLTRTVPQTAHISVVNQTRTVPQSAAIRTTLTRTIPQSAAILSILTRTVPQTAAIKTTLARTVPQTAYVSTPSITRTIPQTAHISVINQTRTVPQTAAILTALTRTVPQSAAIRTTLTRTIPQTAAILTALTRTIPQSASVSTANVTRTIPQSAVIFVANQTRVVPQTAAILTQLARTVPQSAAILTQLARTVPQSAAIRTTLTRTVPQSGSISTANVTRAVPQSAAISVAGLTRTIPQSAAILTILARTVPQTAAIRTTLTRTVPQSAAILTQLARVIPQTAIISTANQTRVIPQSAAVLTQLARSVPQSAAILSTLTRTVPQSAVVLTTLARTIPQTANILIIGVNTRTVPQTAHISVANQARVIPQSAAVLTQLTRTVPQSAAILTALTRTIPQSAAIRTALTRIVPQSAAISTTLARTIPQTASISTAAVTRTVPQTAAISVLGQTRVIPQSAAILVSLARTVPQTAAIRVTIARTVPQTAAILAQLERAVPQSAAIQTATQRIVPQTAAISVASITRTIPQSATILTQLTRTIPQSAAINLVFARTVPQSAVIRTTGQRIVPQTAAISITGTATRDIPQTAAIRVTLTRTVPQSAAILLQLARTIPQSASVSVAGNQRVIPQSAVISAGNQRVIPQTAAISITLTRTIPQSAAIRVTLARSIPQSAAISTPALARTVPQAAAISVASIRVIPQSASILLVLSRSIPQSAAILISAQVTVPQSASIATPGLTCVIPQTAVIIDAKNLSAMQFTATARTLTVVATARPLAAEAPTRLFEMIASERTTEGEAKERPFVFVAEEQL